MLLCNPLQLQSDDCNDKENIIEFFAFIKSFLMQPLRQKQSWDLEAIQRLQVR